MKKTIDLHVHSCVSDGSCRPAELAALAKEKGLAAFALTDHDNISGCREAEAAAQGLGVDFLRGMEMTALYEGRKLHIVCLGFEDNHPAFRQLYQEIRSYKEGGLTEIIDFVSQKGVDISLEKVQAFAAGPLDRYAVMRYLVSLRMYDRAQPLWNLYLDPAARELGLDGNVKAEDALPLIRQAGGVTSLAHFHKDIGLKGMSRREQEEAICKLREMGLDGMERYYPSYEQEDGAFAAYMLEKYGMLATGGTDFHGTNRPGIELGTGTGSMEVPYEFYERIAAKTRGHKSVACNC